LATIEVALIKNTCVQPSTKFYWWIDGCMQVLYSVVASICLIYVGP
jgi:hypothetical protein